MLTAAATVLVVVQRPLVTPSYGFQLAIPALVGVVVGGMDRLVTATLGGFALGVTTGVLADVLPSSARVFLTRSCSPLVIVVLLVRPNGLFAGSEPSWSACDAARPLGAGGS